jgi:hypothetical protein
MRGMVLRGLWQYAEYAGNFPQENPQNILQNIITLKKFNSFNPHNILAKKLNIFVALPSVRDS